MNKVRIISSVPMATPEENFETFAILPIETAQDPNTGDWIATSGDLEARHRYKDQAVADLQTELRDRREKRQLVLP